LSSLRAARLPANVRGVCLPVFSMSQPFRSPFVRAEWLTLLLFIALGVAVFLPRCRREKTSPSAAAATEQAPPRR
jgi:hypothetical protein